MLFVTIGCFLGLYLLCKWGDRDTGYFKSQMAIKNEYDVKQKTLDQRFQAGLMTQEEYEKFSDSAREAYYDEDFVNTVRHTQIGFKDYRSGDYKKR